MKHNPNMFYRSSCQDIEFEGYLLLGGGGDISPALYNEKPMSQTQMPSRTRDALNVHQIEMAVKEGKPIFGICRGLQILDAVFGGKLIQHSVGHSSTTVVQTKWVSVRGDSPLPPVLIDDCASCHHQMVDINHTTGEVIGYSSYPVTCFMSDGNTEFRTETPEIIWWPDKKALAVQFHPEWHHPDHAMNIYLRGLIKELLGLDNVL